MTVGTTLRAWSATASNNSPKGTDVIGTSADDELRQIQATVRQYLASQSSTVAPSAGVADLTTATGHWVPVSGSSTLTGLGSEDAGIEYILNFTGAPILVHSTALQLPGQATINASTSDVCVAESLGSGNWRVWGLSHLDSVPARDSVLATEQASTSGTSIDFTSIPSWAKKITIMFDGVSTSGTDNLLIQIGDSGGIEATSYAGVGGSFTSASQTATASTAGFLVSIAAATDVLYGAVTLSLEDAANFTWVAHGVMSETTTTAVKVVSGRKALSATLDRVRVTTTGGTNTFDAGAVNIMYE